MDTVVELVGGPDDGTRFTVFGDPDALYFFEEGQQFCIPIEYTIYENCPGTHLHAVAHYGHRMPTDGP